MIFINSKKCVHFLPQYVTNINSFSEVGYFPFFMSYVLRIGMFLMLMYFMFCFFGKDEDKMASNGNEICFL